MNWALIVKIILGIVVFDAVLLVSVMLLHRDGDWLADQPQCDCLSCQLADLQREDQP